MGTGTATRCWYRYFLIKGSCQFTMDIELKRVDDIFTPIL
jgi:hypothetical protein